MFKAYQELSKKYHKYLFGYSEVAGMFYNLTVTTKDLKRVVQRKAVEAGQTAQAYANIYLEMLRELHDSPNVR